MNKFDGQKFQNKTKISRRKTIIIKNKEKIIKYKYNIFHLKYQILLNIILLHYIIIFPIYLSKNNFRELSGLYKIKLTINTKGLIQILSSSFSVLPTTIIVNGVSKTFENKIINLTSTPPNTVTLNWNSAITDCSNMFNGLLSINQIDLSSFTSSSVQNMNSMFRGCLQLSKIIFTGFTTSNVNSMSEMFYNCISLTSLDLSSFNTTKVTDISYMFFNCTNLSSLKLVGFSNSLTTGMKSVFQNCKSLTSLDLSNFYTPKATCFGICLNKVNLMDVHL